MTKAERWALTTNIINRWWKELIPEDGVTLAELQVAENRLGITLPPALREWYLLAGHREEIIGNEDYLVPLNKLSIVNNHLKFCVENQAVVSWGIPFQDLYLDDPVVAIIDQDAESFWTTASSVSEFFLLMIVYATCLSGVYNGRQTTQLDIVAKIRQHYAEWYNTTDGYETILGDKNTLIYLRTGRKPDEIQVNVAIRTAKSVGYFLSIVGDGWREMSHHGRYWTHRFHAECADVPPAYIVRSPMNDPIVKLGIFPACHLRSRGPRVEAWPWPSTS